MCLHPDYRTRLLALLIGYNDLYYMCTIRVYVVKSSNAVPVRYRVTSGDAVAEVTRGGSRNAKTVGNGGTMEVDGGTVDY